MSSTPANHAKQKRARSQLSCTLCRQGKLKCNRESDPACDQCIKRNREHACTYLPPPTKQKTPQNVKGRIRHLEELVVNLMSENATHKQGGPKEKAAQGNGEMDSRDTAENRWPTTAPTPPSDMDTIPAGVSSTGRSQQTGQSPQEDVDAATTPFGKMRISRNEISYVDGSHWDAILNSISDLKRDFDGEDGDENGATASEPAQDDTSPESGVAPDIMLGRPPRMTREQLISSMPSKRSADRLLSLWFNSPDPLKPLIHGPSFQIEYRNFWHDPRSTPTMWIGLLYSIMSVAASFPLRDSGLGRMDAKKVVQEHQRYHNLAASAAVLADYTKPKQYTIECLMIYGIGFCSSDTFVEMWLIAGLIVRLALRMGYHRDPGFYPSISPFHGELRRRAWALIGSLDAILSFQVGLPCMVRTIKADAELPRNLLDRDICPEMKELPPSRSPDELTPCSYMRGKSKLARIFAEIADSASETTSREEVLRLDQALEKCKAEVPPVLQMPENPGELVTDPAEVLMCRFNLDLLYHKSKMVLHRPHMTKPLCELSAEENARGLSNSRVACNESALKVLHHHHNIYAASQPGGQLESIKWYMGSISSHDFLLASMVMCLELSLQINHPEFMIISGGVDCPYRNRMMDALKQSQHIWTETAAQTRARPAAQVVSTWQKPDGQNAMNGTEKAAKAMGAMLRKVNQALGLEVGGDAPARHDAPPLASRTAQALQPQAPDNTLSWTAQRNSTDDATLSDFQVLNNDAVLIGSGLFHRQQQQQQNIANPPTSEYSSSETNNYPSAPETFLDGPLAQYPPIPQPDVDMLNDMLDFPTDHLDWAMWDNQFNSDAVQPLPQPDAFGFPQGSLRAEVDPGLTEFWDPVTGEPMPLGSQFGGGMGAL